MSYDKEQIMSIKKSLCRIFSITKEMERATQRHFTMDGHLVGSAGEVFADYYYGIKLHESGRKKYDGEVGGKKVQIKITQRTQVEVKGTPDYLLVLFLKISDTEAEVYEVYNGPGKLALQNRNENKNGEISVSVGSLSEIVTSDSLKQHHEVAKWSKNIKNI